MTRWKYSAEPEPWAHGAMAPSASDRSSSGTTSSGSTSSSVPMPVHSGQAPNGELKENERGWISSMPSGWLLGQAIFSEKRRSRSLSLASRSTKSMMTTPPARPRAVSTESVRRRLEPAVVALGHEAVDDDLDGVLLLLLEGGRLGERDDLAVDPGAREALRLQLGEEVDELALATLHDGGEHLEAGAVLERQQLVDDLLRRLAGDRLAADRAVRPAGAGEEQAEVVVDLGDGADRRARVAVGRLLVDGDRGRQPLDEVDVGLVHLPEELPGVGRERLDVATLPLREDRVEREARLARPREPGEDDEAVAGEVDGHVAQVVLARAADDEGMGVAGGRSSHAQHARWGHRQSPHRRLKGGQATRLRTPPGHRRPHASRASRARPGGTAYSIP